MNLTFNVSILVCARNEEKNIPGLLVSIANQTALSNINEILIADNNSSDRTIEVTRHIAETYQLPVKIFSFSNNNLGASRKFLVDQAASEFVIFIDADCQVDCDWVQTLITHYSNLSKHHPRLAGVGGPNRLPEKNMFQKMINTNLNYGFLHGFSAQAVREKAPHGKSKDHLPTTNALFSRSAILSVGNYSPAFDQVGEDLDLGLRLRKKGYELFLFPNPLVINDCSSNLLDWNQRMFRFGVAQGLTFGRRWSFVTATIVTTTSILATLPFLKSQQQIILLCAWLVISSLLSRPITYQRVHIGSIIKSFNSYLMAIVTLSSTLLFYTFGCYFGIFKKLSKNQSMPSVTASSKG